MKIAFVSDSHGMLSAVERAAKVIKTMGDVDEIVHVGDYAQDAKWFAQFTGLPAMAVTGNCDYPAGDAPSELVLERHGVRIFVVHGHEHRVKRGMERLADAAHQAGAVIVAFGHTHLQAMSWENGILCFNPGSVAQPRGGYPGFAVLTITSDGAFDIMFYDI